MPVVNKFVIKDGTYRIYSKPDGKILSVRDLDLVSYCVAGKLPLLNFYILVF